ncbi:conserved hypothetical integral membrane protein [Alkalibacterium pelagium]|uniref:Conserved hypothetical integral membrane protein n=2 Tax=Alkalibacterium pelagium TaxID=426702 RepID=A0A1H7HUZ6_9LACT|nr:conserved hypothetical integral membrane protein [Alkalibacterium pelagium]
MKPMSKREKIGTFLLDLLDYIFLLIIGFTLFLSLQNNKLRLENIHEYVFTAVLVVILIISSLCFSKKIRIKTKETVISFFRKVYSKITVLTIILFVSVVIFQIILLYHITTPIGWDVGSIFRGVINLPENPNRLNNYLSVNPNNSFFAFSMFLITQVLNRLSPSGSFGETWLAWQLFNTFLLDVGFVLIFLAGKKLFNREIAYISFYLSFIPLSLSPWILVPYTDVIMIPVIGFIFYMYALLKSEDASLIWRVVLSSAIGILTGVSFLLKPSSVIFLIAWFLIEVLKVITWKKYSLINSKVILVVLFISSFVGTIEVYNIFESNQQLITIEEERAKPWLHFVNMGLTGDGGWNIEDTHAVRDLPDQESKREYSRTEIINRLQDHGVFGYPQFLAEKHRNNSDRGDFGWGFDGVQQKPEDPPINYFATMMRDTYYQASGKTDNIRFFMQIFWVITLIGLLFTYNKNDRKLFTKILKLGILGAFLYLLLFEGGRSRYLIQYLPMFYILSAYGWSNRLTRWLNDK